MSISYQVYEIMSIMRNPHIKYGFLKGSGGSGKTYSISEFIKHSKTKPYQYIFIGPTGKSVSVAEEKGLTGSTIHRFFGILNNNSKVEINKYIKSKYGSKSSYIKEMKHKLLEIKYIFIDEISMVNDQLLEHIIMTVEKAASKNIKLILAGDYHQIPPVIKTGEFLKSSLDTIVELISSREMKMVEFNTRYRSNNEFYNEFLFDLRSGKYEDVKTVSNYLKHFFNVYKGKINENIKYKVTYLEHKNDVVRSINEELLEALPSPLVISKRKILVDEYKPEDIELRNDIIRDFQMDEELSFKVGAKILFRVNDMDGVFKNGDEGIIKKINTDSVIVEKFAFDGIIEILVKKHIYHTTELEHEQGVMIEIEQYPFSLGSARTIHKSQGDGFDFLHLNFDFLDHGKMSNQAKWQMLYVCLSRVINPNNVYIEESSLKLLESKWYLLKHKGTEVKNDKKFTYINIDYKKLSLNFECGMDEERYLRRI